MNIKLKLSLQFTFITFGILLFFSLLVYFFSYSSQLSKFRQNLLDSAKNTATLLINVEEVDSTLLQKIHQSTISREKEEMVITDSQFKLLYSNNIQYLNDSTIIADYSNSDVSYFTVREFDGVFYKHIFEKKSYFVYALAYDKTRVENLSGLIRILSWGIIFSLWLSVLISYFFAKKAMSPVAEIIRSVKEINPLKMGNRLDEGNKKDELAQLAITFNTMIADLELAFRNQEDFVTNASHEMRTPLTIMIGESEYILRNDKTPEDYKTFISGIKSDLIKLNFMLNNLLELAQIRGDKTFTFEKIRLDEITFDAISHVKHKYPGRKIIPKIIYPENEAEILIDGNEGLLAIVFHNLIDNACKFSEGDVQLDFTFKPESIIIRITDSGIGIPEDELRLIARPFSRASNAKFIGGFGVGLSLVKKILELHKADMKIESKFKAGTTITLVFYTNHS